MKNSRIFKVIIGLTMQSYAGQRKLAGILRFLSGNDLWDMTLLRSASELTLDLVEQTKSNTDGYLLSLHESQEIRQALVRSGKPIIFLDEIDLRSIFSNENATFLKTNQNAIGAAAANHFLRQANFASFAFVHAIGKPHWSLGRAEGFKRALSRQKSRRRHCPRRPRFHRRLRDQRNQGSGYGTPTTQFIRRFGR